MSHLHSLAQSMYIATFLPEHVLTTCFADYVTSTSGAIRLAFDDLPLASSGVLIPSNKSSAYTKSVHCKMSYSTDGASHSGF